MHNNAAAASCMEERRDDNKIGRYQNSYMGEKYGRNIWEESMENSNPPVLWVVMAISCHPQ